MEKIAIASDHGGFDLKENIIFSKKKNRKKKSGNIGVWVFLIINNHVNFMLRKYPKSPF